MNMTESPKHLNTHQKALAINLDATRYGTFAEIGAGQEVVRWFFRVEGAVGTVAKSMSAYDNTADSGSHRCKTISTNQYRSRYNIPR